MRYPILIAALLLAAGCSSKSSHEQALNAVVKHGVIASKRDVSMDEVQTGTRGTTSVYGSVSSGGGVSIGIGFGVLLSQIGSGSKSEPIRYEIDLVDEGQITIFHSSKDFEVGDCVEITVFEDEDEHPPTMRRDKDGCQSAE
jgi:hypothetical protein